MSKQIHHLHALADLLGRRCPFILFATLDQGYGGLSSARDHGPRLAVFLSPGTARWKALREVLNVVEEASWPDLEVVILNDSDPETKFRASQGICVMTAQGMNELLSSFRRQAWLDYRLFRAHLRRKGITDIEGGLRQ